ncbi:DUF6903 family protein [Actinophytocola sp.]|uniref:DUF6903 family protein n=1 Tax=Actinophytocola sp. TaxID=1872138 RepID=UPI002ED200E7
MEEKTRTALLVSAGTISAAACVVIVVVARPTVGWGSLLVMLTALAGLLVLLAVYNRRFQ